MIVKIFLATLFAVCQAAKNEPWWIQMFFPNVSFTGKYHPSNYKVEKSPLFPNYVQNPNDIWSPAYWMPYKLAYSQYWIDLIDNATKAEEEKAKETLAQTEQAWSGYGSQQYGVSGHYGQDNQYGANVQYSQNGEYENNAASNGQTIAEEASSLAQDVQIQAGNMNAEAEEIVAEANVEAKNQMQVLISEANKKKEEIAAEAQLINEQAEKVSAQIDRATEFQLEAIAEEVSQFEEDVKKRFAPLLEEAEELALKASEIVGKVAPQL